MTIIIYKRYWKRHQSNSMMDRNPKDLWVPQFFSTLETTKRIFFFLETTVTCVNTIFTIKVPVIFPDSFKSNLVTANTVPKLKCRELELRRNKTEFNYSSCFSKYFKLTNEESSIFRTKLVANEEVKRKITISDNC